jgi:hypothetical protein
MKTLTCACCRAVPEFLRCCPYCGAPLHASPPPPAPRVLIEHSAPPTIEAPPFQRQKPKQYVKSIGSGIRQHMLRLAYGDDVVDGLKKTK